jgi:hypothetical protein
MKVSRTVQKEDLLVNKCDRHFLLYSINDFTPVTSCFVVDGKESRNESMPLIYVHTYLFRYCSVNFLTERNP